MYDMARLKRNILINPIIPWVIVAILTFYLAFINVGISPETYRRNIRDSKCKEFNKPGSFYRAIPMEQRLDHTGDITATFEAFESRVSIIVYGLTRSDKCIREQLENITDVFPKVRIIVSVKNIIRGIRYKNVNFLTGVTSEGGALNAMIAMVKTDYFLYLSRGDTIDTYDSDNSVGWLYRALEKVPKLDVIGASFLAYNSSLKYPQLDIQCHRTKMCHWVFSQTYEYQYSVGDVMICEETSSSFMARTRSLSALTFDPTLDTMVTADFFWRNKARLVVGLMPESFLHVTKTCQDATPSAVEDSLNKQSFMDKYSLTRVVNSFERVIDYPTEPKRIKSTPVFPEMNYTLDGGVNTPQAKETLRFYIGFMDDVFNKNNISYFVGGGVALGGVKMRDVLPWDTGDVDTGFHGVPCNEVQKAVKKEMAARGVKFKRFDSVPQPDGRCLNMANRWNMLREEVYLREPRGVEEDKYMYIFIYDRYVPVRRSLFEIFRFLNYGDYLQNIDDQSQKFHQCTIPGHHACVPDEFAQGSGNWKDFYC